MKTICEIPVKGIFQILGFEKIEGPMIEITGQPLKDCIVLIGRRMAVQFLHADGICRIKSLTGTILKLFAKIL